MRKVGLDQPSYCNGNTPQGVPAEPYLSSGATCKDRRGQERSPRLALHIQVAVTLFIINVEPVIADQAGKSFCQSFGSGPTAMQLCGKRSTTRPSRLPNMALGRGAHRVEHFWLCGDCLATLQLQQAADKGIRLIPRRAGSQPRRPGRATPAEIARTA